MVFTSLVTRAAMEGGLSPEIAYPVGDAYIQAAEDCRDSAELAVLANAMYHDFIYRVHEAPAADRLHGHPLTKFSSTARSLLLTFVPVASSIMAAA